jgi:hypothetical protein
MDIQEGNAISRSSDDSGWYLNLLDCRVQLIQIDLRIGLLPSDNESEYQVYIGAACGFKDRVQTIFFGPENISSLAPILALFNLHVISVCMSDSGHLVIGFADDRVIEGAPPPKYEAWELGGANAMFISDPGVGVSVYR